MNNTRVRFKPALKNRPDGPAREPKVQASQETSKAGSDLPLTGELDLLNSPLFAQCAAASRKSQVLLSMQRAYGNAYVQRMLQRQDVGEAGQGPSYQTSSNTFIPVISADPPRVTLKIGEHHIQAFKVVNKNDAPRGTVFNWYATSTTYTTLDDIGMDSQDRGRTGLMWVQAIAPGNGNMRMDMSYQVPGGPLASESTGDVPVTILAPQWSLTNFTITSPTGETRLNPERLRVGDTIKLLITIDNIDMTHLEEYEVQSPDIPGILEAEGESGWRGANQFELTLRATGVGKVAQDIRIAPGRTPMDQAAKVHFETHIEMDKQEFLNWCSQADVEARGAYHSFKMWMLGLSTAYANAYKYYIDTLKGINERLNDDELLASALIFFVSGGMGGVIGQSMRAGGSSEFMIEGVKDLSKWGMRTGAAALQTGRPGLNALPTDPLIRRNQIEDRVEKESLEVANTIIGWMNKANRNDPDFFLDFNPSDKVNEALQIAGTRIREGLPRLQEGETEKTFEKGIWAEWLKKYGYLVVLNISAGIPTTDVKKHPQLKYIKRRCDELGLDIEPYMRIAKERAEAAEAEHRPDRVTYGIAG